MIAFEQQEAGVPAELRLLHCSFISGMAVEPVCDLFESSHSVIRHSAARKLMVFSVEYRHSGLNSSCLQRREKLDALFEGTSVVLVRVYK